jgi:hypothetical protein
MTKAELRRAARILRREAATIRKACTIGGRWANDPQLDGTAKSDHDEMLGLARKLEAHARTVTAS